MVYLFVGVIVMVRIVITEVAVASWTPSAATTCICAVLIGRAVTVIIEATVARTTATSTTTVMWYAQLITVKRARTVFSVTEITAERKSVGI